MKLKSGYENRRARVEMLPLIDVVFLLLVFFIYAMVSMVLHHGIKVDLPKAGHSTLDQRDYISITITEENTLLFDETETSKEDLIPLIQSALAEKGEDTPVYISGDREADLGIAIELLDHFQGAGIEKVSFTCSKDSQP